MSPYVYSFLFLFVYKCTDHCHRVTTQSPLINIIIIIIIIIIKLGYDDFLPHVLQHSIQQMLYYTAHLATGITATIECTG